MVTTVFKIVLTGFLLKYLTIFIMKDKSNNLEITGIFLKVFLKGLYRKGNC